jgi:hypothetical protein
VGHGRLENGVSQVGRRLEGGDDSEAFLEQPLRERRRDTTLQTLAWGGHAG